MRRTFGLLILALAAAPSPAAEPLGTQDARVAKLTAAIDKHLTEAWAAKKVTPAPDADDAEYCRRVYLDLIGRIPRVSESRAFAADPSPAKRAALVEKLLGTAAFAAHYASVTRADWLPQTNTPQTFFQGQQFEQYLQRKFARNAPLDEIAREVLAAPLGRVQVAGPQRFVMPAVQSADAQALVSFYQANELKPENLAASVSRLFLGAKLECAQCHDHPFNSYSRDQFWQLAAFFGELNPSAVRPSDGPSFLHANTIRIAIPGTPRAVTATFFDGTEPEWTADRSPRKELADWVASPRNPYFARNLANRIWAHFLGTGIIDPVDEPGDANPPSHPELLRDLALALADSGFDQRVVIRAVAASRAYTRTSRQTHPSQADPRLFARVAVRGLTSNQIYDSFLTATGQRPNPQRAQGFFNPNDPSGASAFGTQFARGTGKATEAETSILQALLLMNGQSTANETSLDKSTALAAVVDAPFLDTPKRVEALFLSALARKPTQDEAEKFTSYVDRGGPSGDKDKALADVLWVLLNSTEFLFNH
jgi:hypothetical protein